MFQPEFIFVLSSSYQIEQVPAYFPFFTKEREKIIFNILYIEKFLLKHMCIFFTFKWYFNLVQDQK